MGYTKLSYGYVWQSVFHHLNSALHSLSGITICSFWFINNNCIQEITSTDFLNDRIMHDTTRSCSPRLTEMADMFSSLKTSRATMATLHANGFPPYVDPCSMGLRVIMTSSKANNADTGKTPPERALIVEGQHVSIQWSTSDLLGLRDALTTGRNDGLASMTHTVQSTMIREMLSGGEKGGSRSWCSQHSPCRPSSRFFSLKGSTLPLR